MIHNCVQNLLRFKQDQIEIVKFERTWKKFCSLYKKYLEIEETKQLFEAGRNILQNVRQFIEKEFGEDYEVLSVEEELLHKIENSNIKFKAFVDLVILDRTNNRLIILDLKSCASAFMWKKYVNKEKERQLIFYKHFYCLKYNLFPKEVQTIFILMEKDPKSKKPIDLHKITSGERKISNHLKVLNESIKNLVDLEMFPKNRKGCMWCQFKETKYCTNPNIFRW